MCLRVGFLCLLYGSTSLQISASTRTPPSGGNGQVKQSATLSHMIWSVAEQISRLSQAFELKPGDIIYSGTPENVGPVMRGDLIEIHIDKLPELSVRVV